jgi:hypothetical protein
MQTVNNSLKGTARPIIVTVLSAASIMLFIVWPLTNIYLRGHNDFLAFYAGGKLAFSGDLYDPIAISRVQVESAGTTGPALRFVRLPYYAMLLHPLSKLPYLWSYGAWQALNLIAAVASVLLWPTHRVRFAFLTAAWLPLYWGFAGGQDVSFLLIGISATSLLLDRNRDAAAGAVFAAACLLKFHFLWLAPLAMVRRPSMAASFTLMVLLLFAAGFATDLQWPIHYYATVISQRQAISPGQPWSLFRWAGWPVLAVGLALAVVATRRLPHHLALPVLIGVAVIVSPHAYIHDYALLIPAFTILSTLPPRNLQIREMPDRAALQPQRDCS